MIAGRFGLVFGACLFVLIDIARAQAPARRRFDPEDLDLEASGYVHVDLQWGVVRGANANRWIAPDFGVDLGIAENVELGVDGVLAFEGTPNQPWAWDHAAGDNLWLSSKLGLFSVGDRARGAWSGGIQIGPKLATAPGAHGTGYEGIALLALTRGTTQLIANLGGFVDPGYAVGRGRPVGIEGGLDLITGLGDGKTWRFVADLSAVYSLSGQPSQLLSTFGPQVSVTPWLELSPQALIGLLHQTDRVGFLLVVSPRWRLVPK